MRIILEDIAPILSAISDAFIIVLTFLTWRANKKSANIAEQLKLQEENRDKEVMVEKANRLYFAMINIFEYLAWHMYDENSRKVVYFDNGWVNDLAKIRSVLTESEAKDVYDLFRNIQVVNFKNKLEDILHVARWVFITDLCLYYKDSSFHNKMSYEDLLHRRWRFILEKVRKLCNIHSMGELEVIKKTECLDKIKKPYTDQQLGYEIAYEANVIKHIKIWDIDGEILKDC